MGLNTTRVNTVLSAKKRAAHVKALWLAVRIQQARAWAWLSRVGVGCG